MLALAAALVLGGATVPAQVRFPEQRQERRATRPDWPSSSPEVFR